MFSGARAQSRQRKGKCGIGPIAGNMNFSLDIEQVSSLAWDMSRVFQLFAEESKCDRRAHPAQAAPGLPQAEQKRNKASFLCPQPEQKTVTATTGFPHLVQNAAPGASACPQEHVEEGGMGAFCPHAEQNAASATS